MQAFLVYLFGVTYEDMSQHEEGADNHVCLSTGTSTYLFSSASEQFHHDFMMHRPYLSPASHLLQLSKSLENVHVFLLCIFLFCSCK